MAHATFLSSFCADIIATRAQTSGDQEKHFHHKPSAQSSMDHAIPKLTLRRFKTRFSCSFLLQLLASCASERVQHHGAHPWIRGKSKQKRPKAILKNRNFLIKGVVWPRSCIEKPLPKLAAETKRPQQPKRFNGASPKSVANVFKAKKPLRQNVRKLMSAMVGHVKFGVFDLPFGVGLRG